MIVDCETPHPSLLIYSGRDDEAIRVSHRHGRIVRIVTGRYVRQRHWESWSAEQRHVMFALAVTTRSHRPIALARESALALWRLPLLGEWPQRAQVVDPQAATARVTTFSVVHAGPVTENDLVAKEGILVTSPERTLVDIALRCSLRTAVVALDEALRRGLVTSRGLSRALAEHPAIRGRVKAERALAFANGKAESVGESLTRLVMREAGFTPPLSRENSN